MPLDATLIGTGSPRDPARFAGTGADALTGLPTRQEFLHSLDDALRSHDPETVAVLTVDLDHFRFVNDTVGHTAGDLLITSAADALRRQAPGAGCIARTSGDEFALWTVVDRTAAAITLAERLRSALDRPFTIDAVDHYASASVGLVIADGASGAADLVAEADTAMASAKAAGGNGYAVFDANLRDRMHERAQALRELSRAIQHREIDLDVQPIIDLRDGSIAYEVLARWNHPTRGRLSPAAFIGLAEESGLIGRLGHQILELGASHAAALGTRVSVNVSVRQFNRTLTQQVAALIERYQLDRGQLIVEITESAVIDNGQAQPILDGLRRVGADIWIDDFGTGYSSLSRLTGLTVDGLKLPREFVENLDSPQGWGIASAIVAIARALDIVVIAEGVETRHQLDQLRDLGCDAAQGFLLGRPRPFLQEQAAMIAGQAAIVLPPPLGAPAAPGSVTIAPTDPTTATTVTFPTIPTDDANAPSDAHASSLLWDHLPLGLLVVDSGGTICLANDRAAAMAGRSAADVVGRSLFEFLPQEDSDFVVETLARGTDFASKLLGPIRLRFRHRDGSVSVSEHWAYEAPPSLGVEGYVVTMSHQSTGDVLAEAFRAIAGGGDLDHTLSTISQAMSSHPMEGAGAFMVVEDGHIERIVGAWPFGADHARCDTLAPWTVVARGGAELTIPIAELPRHLREEPVAHGHAALWLRAVDLQGSRPAACSPCGSPRPRRRRRTRSATSTKPSPPPRWRSARTTTGARCATRRSTTTSPAPATAPSSKTTRRRCSSRSPSSSTSTTSSGSTTASATRSATSCSRAPPSGSCRRSVTRASCTGWAATSSRSSCRPPTTGRSTRTTPTGSPTPCSTRCACRTRSPTCSRSSSAPASAPPSPAPASAPTTCSAAPTKPCCGPSATASPAASAPSTSCTGDRSSGVRPGMTPWGAMSAFRGGHPRSDTG